MLAKALKKEKEKVACIKKLEMKTNILIYTGTGRHNLIVIFTHCKTQPTLNFFHSLITEVPIFKNGKFNIEKNKT